MRGTAGTLLAAVAVCTVLRAGGQIEARHYPAEMTWAVHLDLKSLNQSPMGEFVRGALDENARRGLGWLQAMSGISLTNDVDSLVIVGQGSTATGAVVYAYGRFDVERLTALAGGAKNFQNRALGARSLISWTDKGKAVSLCFIDPTLAVLSQDGVRVEQAVARVDGQAPGMGREGPFARTLLREDGRFLAVQASDVAGLARLNPQLQMFRQAEALLLEVRQMGGGNGLDLALLIKGASAEMAQQFHQAAQGMQAILLLQAGQNPEAAELARGAAVALAGDTVKVDLKLPVESLRKMVTVRIEQQREAAEARRARRAAKRPAQGGEADGGEADEKPAPERPAF